VIATVTMSCGDNPVQPTPLLSISSVSPNNGPTVGGTQITVTGSNFSAGATVTIGGTVALNIVVVDATTISATTAPRVGGPADVTVSLSGRGATLSGGFTYLDVQNQAPTITAVRAQGSKFRNQPSRYADLDEDIEVSVDVSDNETPIPQLRFEWSATPSGGTFSGEGRVIRWRAPRQVDRTPVAFTLTTTVIEQYQTVDTNGSVVTREHRTTGTVVVQVHNSSTEIADVSRQFLTDFSNSSVAPETVVRNFSDNCAGKSSELNDVKENRSTRTITASNIGAPTVRINFGGVCDFRSRSGDACVTMSCQWTSTIKATGTTENAKGTCFLTAVHEAPRWLLCESEFEGSSSTNLRFPF
jgi:hypothetical protein